MALAGACLLVARKERRGRRDPLVTGGALLAKASTRSDGLLVRTWATEDNSCMRHGSALLLSTLLLQACSPSLNWREVRLPGGDYKALLPCKSDQATRPQRLAGQDLQLTVQGCKAAGGLYAVSVAELAAPSSLPAVLAQWQQQLLTSLKASATTEHPVSIADADSLPPAVYLEATGEGADGRALSVQALWFVRGSRIYHAALYAERITEPMSVTFFSGVARQ
jgi:hypothetical protein